MSAVLVELHSVKPTPRLFALILAPAAVIAAEAVLYNRVSEASITLTAIVLGMVFGSRVLAELNAKYFDKLVFKREFSKPVWEGGEVAVSVVVENPTPVPFTRITMIDKYPQLFKLVRGVHSASTILTPKSTFKYTYVVKPVFGKHSFQGIEVVVSDPLKLFNFKAIVNPAENTVKVKPKPLPLPAKLAGPPVERGLGLGRTRVRGYGQEFYGIREYYPGDDYRFIDWKSLARTGKLYVKVFEREANLSVVFVVDASQNSMRSVIGETPLEYMARLVACLAHSSIKRGDWVEVVVRSGTVAKSGYGRGFKHYQRILETLSSIEWNPAAPQMPLGSVLLAEASSIPRRTKTVFFVITSVLDDREVESLAHASDKLGARGHIVYVVLLLPELFEYKLFKGVDAGVYYGLIYDAVFQSRLAKEKLAHRGVRVVVSGPRDIAEALYKLIEKHRVVTA